MTTLIHPVPMTVPERMRHLPVRRGFVVPWFVAQVDGEYEFRVADAEKRFLALRNKLCWVCGGQLGRYMTFVLGPMCGINRTTAEPPCHWDCATYSAKVCPFLSRPQMDRRENDLPETKEGPGVAIKRNPGVVLLWTTRHYSLFSDGKGGVLLQVGDPTSLEWFAEGRAATRAEVEHSVATGIGTLEAMAVAECPAAVVDLARRKAWLEMQYPIS